MMNRQAPLFAAAALEQGESLQKMAASEASPLIWQALKEKSGKRKTGAITRVRQQKEELVHSVKNNPRSHYAAGRRHAYPEEARLARPPSFVPPQGRYFFFSFGPCTARFLFFFWQEKEKMGGAMNQPSLVSILPRPKGEHHSPSLE